VNENWLLHVERSFEAPPWPWPETDWEEVTGDQAADLPGAVADFARYSPSDGCVDMAHVPTDLPQERPLCRTRLAVYHDAASLYVFIAAERPAEPIPELADLAREDFSLVIPLGSVARGLYFGLNEKGEAIGCVQIWDPDVQPPDDSPPWPFSLLRTPPGTGPSASAAGILREGYAARVIVTPAGPVGGFRVARDLVASGFCEGALRLTAGRRCYRTSELVSWGSPVIWSPRPDRMGTVRLVERPQAPLLPRLSRLAMVYDPATEEADFEGHWRGPVSGPGLDAIAHSRHYAPYMRRVTFALNGLEQTVDLAEQTRCHFRVPDGWNRLEVLTATGEPLALSFQKLTGNRILPSRAASCAPPSKSELAAAFRAWHERHDKTCLGNGVWGERAAPRHCLCHNGVFHADPYCMAMAAWGRDPAWEARVRETAQRMLAAQKPDGWFPCHCSGDPRGGEPELGDGGAFTNGSVGEFMAVAGQLLGEASFISSAQRAADYGWYRWEDNQNYAAFALWHLAALQTVDPRDEWLRKGLYYARHFVTRDIGPSGAQDGHNYFTGYGDITLKGMAVLLGVLPPEHPYRCELRERTLRFANQVVARQQESGLFAGRNRKYLGYHHLVPGLFHVARACPDQAAALAPALAAMARAACAKTDADPGTGLTLALAAAAGLSA